MAYSAADFAGLIEAHGDDQIQAVLAAAFMGSRSERPVDKRNCR
jgi:hypothetical protein